MTSSSNNFNVYKYVYLYYNYITLISIKWLKATRKGVVRKITREELRVHNVVGNGGSKKDDLWVLVNGKVYDLSKFYRNHPGGPDVIEEWAGKDGTKVFEDAGHPKNSKKEMETYLIGEYVEPR